jgi:hypothetical protein
MGAEPLARVLRHKAGYVVDQGLVEGGVVMVGREGLDRAGGQRERGQGIHDGLLQLEQCGRGAGHDAGQAHLTGRHVIALEGLQGDGGQVGRGEGAGSGSVDALEILGGHEALNQRDVRAMGIIKGEALGERLQQAGIGGLGVGQHRGVRLQQHVDGGDGHGFQRAGALAEGPRPSLWLSRCIERALEAGEHPADFLGLAQVGHGIGDGVAVAQAQQGASFSWASSCTPLLT